jgi:hypothetical protein
MNYEEYSEIVHPTMKFNSGNPVVLCKCCSLTICFISYNQKKKKYLVDYVRDSILENVHTYDNPPLFCKDCVSYKFLMIEKEEYHEDE